MCAASNWLWNFAIGYASEPFCCFISNILAHIVPSAPYLVNPGAGNANLGVKVFFIWGTTCLCCIVFAYFCIPETKGASFRLHLTHPIHLMTTTESGLTLEQVDIMYQNTTPMRSGSYNKRLINENVHASDANALGKIHSRHEVEEKL